MATPVRKKNQPGGSNSVFAAHPALYGGFLVFVAATAAFFLLIAPAVRALETGGSASVGDLTNKIGDEQAKIDAENRLIDALGSVSAADRAKIDYALPVDPDSEGALAQLAAIAAAAGGTLGSVDFSQPTDLTSSGLPNNVGAIDASLNIGVFDYAKFKSFLGDVESNLRVMNVNNFVFSGTADSVSLNLRTYYRK